MILLLFFVSLVHFINCQNIPVACQLNNFNCDGQLKYRSFNGTCNNLKQPWLGMASKPYSRLLPSHYRDGISLPQNNLPSPRKLSSTLFKDFRYDNSELTHFWMEFGQLVAHDILITFEQDGRIDCCLPENKPNEDICFAIDVPSDDEFYEQFDVTCLNNARHRNTFLYNCSNNGPAEQINDVTSFLDASDIYGSSLETANQLRTFKGGRLNTTLINNREFMPLGTPGGACNVTGDFKCFKAGDPRVNQNPMLIVMTTSFYIIHNKIVEGLSYINPHWSDEKLYQEARKIVIAFKQHLTYKYWLPPMIGLDFVVKNKLLPLPNGYCDLYNENIDVRTTNEFAGANFKTPHFTIQGQLDMFHNFQYHGSLNISNHLFSPGIEQVGNNFDKLMFGMGMERCRGISGILTDELRNLLIKGNKPYGSDLASLDIQRGRCHGLAAYTTALDKLLGIKIKTFDDLEPLMVPQRFSLLKELYDNDPHKIDLYVGATLENLIDDTFVGPLNQVIFGEQFYRYKVGDRFWYERPGQFTPAQLQEIRKFTPAKLMCEGSHHALSVPRNPFMRISTQNPVRACMGLPKIDLHAWKETVVNGNKYVEK